MSDGIRPAELIAVVYAELYARQRALIAVLEQRGVVEPERFETEVQSYYLDHADDLVREAERWWNALVRNRFPEAFE
jgi:hypothetical protein